MSRSSSMPMWPPPGLLPRGRWQILPAPVYGLPTGRSSVLRSSKLSQSQSIPVVRLILAVSGRGECMRASGDLPSTSETLPRERILNIRTPRAAVAPLRGPRPRDIRCQTRTRNALHHDGATGDEVGGYEIEHIDLDAIVHRFVFEPGVLLGTTSQALPRSACGRRARRRGLHWRRPEPAYPSLGMGRAARVRYPEAWDVSRPCIVRETPSTRCSTGSSPSTWRSSCARRRRPATGRACRSSSSASSGSS